MSPAMGSSRGEVGGGAGSQLPSHESMPKHCGRGATKNLQSWLILGPFSWQQVSAGISVRHMCPISKLVFEHGRARKHGGRGATGDLQNVDLNPGPRAGDEKMP